VGRNYRSRILLVLVDDETLLTSLQDLNRIAFSTNFTLICTWSNIECARYLETFKSYENKSSSSIQSKEETEFIPRLNKVLTNVRSINKSDVTTLLDVFGNLSNICNAEEQQLVLCPGLGEKKVKRLFQALHEPFIANPVAKRTKVSASSMFSNKVPSKLAGTNSATTSVETAKESTISPITTHVIDCAIDILGGEIEVKQGEVQVVSRDGEIVTDEPTECVLEPQSSTALNNFASQVIDEEIDTLEVLSVRPAIRRTKH
jgi:NAD-dependent DNA ligase